jgi:inorganic pyrophosphatase
LEPGKWVKVLGWAGVEVAHAEITDGMKRYRAENPQRA